MTIHAWQRGAALLVIGATLAGCSSSPTMNTTGDGSRVQALASLAFSPSVIGVHPGESVTWVFGSVGHNVTFDAASGAPESIPGTNANTSIARTFASTGTFNYHCTIHPSMTGSVIVSDNTVTSPPPPPPPPPPPGYNRKP